MIINALYQYYERLLADESSGVSRPGFSKAKVSYVMVLDTTGQLLDIVDLKVEKRSKVVPRELNVPEQVKRTSGVAANFLCDNCTYVLGLNQKGKQGRVQEAFKAFVNLHEEILDKVNDEGAEAILSFLRNWDIGNASNHPQIVGNLDGLSEGSNLVFRLEGSEGYIHQREFVRQAWDKYRQSQASQVVGQCLVSGEISPIARLHPSIKGVADAQSSGASLVSFNLDAFTSYGKSQSYNAPISENVVFGYTTALNWLLSNQRHKVRIGDTTTVFWAERSTAGMEEDLLGALFYPIGEADNNEKKDNDAQVQTVRDPQTVKLLHDIFVRVRKGEAISQLLTGVDPEVNFHILGLAPNASRLSVRFWHVKKFGEFVEKICQHYSDLAIVKSFDYEPDFIPIASLLKETAPLGDTKRISPLLGGVVMRSILTGMPYPQALYNAAITRIRADQKVNYTRASIIKACLTRNQHYNKQGGEEQITMALDEHNTDTAYMLGRLFALLEKAQKDASNGLNATIKDRYFGSASATPGSVFPILLRLSQHHIAKAEYGRNVDKRIEDVLGGINVFPAHLNLEQQGLFVLGYYHQRKAIWPTHKKEAEEV